MGQNAHEEWGERQSLFFMAEFGHEGAAWFMAHLSHEGAGRSFVVCRAERVQGSPRPYKLGLLSRAIMLTVELLSFIGGWVGLLIPARLRQGCLRVGFSFIFPDPERLKAVRARRGDPLIPRSGIPSRKGRAAHFVCGSAFLLCVGLALDCLTFPPLLPVVARPHSRRPPCALPLGLRSSILGRLRNAKNGI